MSFILFVYNLLVYHHEDFLWMEQAVVVNRNNSVLSVVRAVNCFFHSYYLHAPNPLWSRGRRENLPLRVIHTYTHIHNNVFSHASLMRGVILEIYKNMQLKSVSGLVQNGCRSGKPKHCVSKPKVNSSLWRHLCFLFNYVMSCLLEPL